MWDRPAGLGKGEGRKLLATQVTFWSTRAALTTGGLPRRKVRRWKRYKRDQLAGPVLDANMPEFNPAGV